LECFRKKVCKKTIILYWNILVKRVEYFTYVCVWSLQIYI